MFEQPCSRTVVHWDVFVLGTGVDAQQQTRQGKVGGIDWPDESRLPRASACAVTNARRMWLNEVR